MNCNTTHYRANSSSVPGDPTTKYAIKRARPYAYDPNVPMERRTDYQAHLSFFSGHASISFASAVAFSYTYALRHPTGSGKSVVWASTLGIATLTSLCRIWAGDHFWTDIIVGAAVGAGVSYAVVALHEKSAAAGGGGASAGPFSKTRLSGLGVPMAPLSVTFRF